MDKLTILFLVFGVLVLLVNIITEILKKVVSKENFPTPLLCVVISEILTITSFIAYCQIVSLTIAWYMVFGAAVIGLVVSYAAIFGYDNIIKELKELITKLSK